MTRRIYLDDNAGAPLRPCAREAMLAALAVSGNPSSVHAEGRQARTIVEDARETIARVVNAKPSEVVFTSGAAEANAAVMAAPWARVLASRIEHESVLTGLTGHGAIEVQDIRARRDGLVDVGAIGTGLAADAGPVEGLLTLQLANNETGVIQPVAEAAALAHQHELMVHTDAVQALGRVPVDFAGLGVDLMSLSAHKIGGPKGVGALVIRDGVVLPSLIAGGQERRRRGGTENVAGIAGFAAAAAEAARELTELPKRLARLRDEMEAEIRAIVPNVTIIGAEAPRLHNTCCLALPGQRAETLVIRLDLMGFAVSAGAACSSGKVGASHVLAAMGLPSEIARAAIRVSIGRDTTATDVGAFVAAIREISAGVGWVTRRSMG